jgi:hypothetical protein
VDDGQEVQLEDVPPERHVGPAAVLRQEGRHRGGAAADGVDQDVDRAEVALDGVGEVEGGVRLS